MDTVDIDLERAETQASRRLSQHATNRTHSRSHAGRQDPLANQAENLVHFDGPNDLDHPQNWSTNKKLLVTAIASYTCLCSTFTSSVFSATTSDLADYFRVSIEVSTLSTSLFVLGYAFGPLVWGPLSELYGRRPPILIAMFGFSVFSAAVAAANDLQTVLICRLFSGVMGSSPLSIVAAIFADIYDNQYRGTAIAVFAMCVFIAPMLGPSIGGFTVESSLGWRWDAYWPLILGAISFILMAAFLPETYAPTILKGKAAKERVRTRNWAVHAKQEEMQVDFGNLLRQNFTRPLRLLVSEPLLFLVSFYMSFIYGILYLFLTAYPAVFHGIYHFNAGTAGLPFLGLALGMGLAGSTMIYTAPGYNRKLVANYGIPVPEWRLPLAIIGGVFFSVGLFWFGWTGYREEIHWMAPVASGVFTGFGLLAIFIQLLNYIVDTYLDFAASAVAANTIMRSGFAAGFPLFAGQMLKGLGINWAVSLLGFLALILIPVPLTFYIYGNKLRKRSHFASRLSPR